VLVLIEPVYRQVSSNAGRPPYPLANMPWMHLMQHWYGFSDPAMEDVLIDVATIRRLQRSI
jgi:IS5 family transposase